MTAAQRARLVQQPQTQHALVVLGAQTHERRLAAGALTLTAVSQSEAAISSLDALLAALRAARLFASDCAAIGFSSRAHASTHYSCLL